MLLGVGSTSMPHTRALSAYRPRVAFCMMSCPSMRSGGGFTQTLALNPAAADLKRLAQMGPGGAGGAGSPPEPDADGGRAPHLLRPTPVSLVSLTPTLTLSPSNLP